MVEALERESAVPLYQQLEEIFHEKIRTGEWKTEQRIPSENELNRAYGLSRMTVRGVLNKLTRDGLLVRVPGKGTYVSAAKIDAVSPAYQGMREQLESMGYATSTRLISAELVLPTTAVRERLALEPNEQVYEIVRLRSADGAPISLHRSFVPARVAPKLDAHDLVSEQLCVVLEESYGLPMSKVQERLEAVAIDGEEARTLGMRRGEPALLLSDLIADPKGRPFEYSTIVFRGDRLRLKFDYER